MQTFIRSMLALLFVGVAVCRLPAQDAAAPAGSDASGAAAAPEKVQGGAAAAPEAVVSPGAAAAEFEKILTEWKSLLAQFGDLQVKYRNATEEEKSEIKKQWKQLVDKGDVMEPKLLAAAEKAFVEAPNANKDVSDLLLQVCVHYVGSDDYENAYRLGKVLVDHQCQDKRTCNLAGLAALAVGNLDDAAACLKLAKENNVAGAVGIDLLDDLAARFQADPAAYKQDWDKEQQIRAAEAKADDLPRVLMKTNKGDIEIELLENEAPIAVGNFVSLVEKGFYNGLTFHRVLPGFMAQGGDPSGNGSGGPGYTIPCEAQQPNHRLHFRGTLSMAHAGRDTGGSQFFLTFLPTKHLDGVHTVFGRVVKGFDVLAKLQRRDPDDASAPNPDKIVEAKVLRKRAHEYKPTKMGE